MHLPAPRGPVSTAIIGYLDGTADSPPLAPALSDLSREPSEVLDDEDLQLSLWVLYELHYRGFDGVPDDREWDPELIRLRRVLESEHEAAVRALTTAQTCRPVDVAAELDRIVRADDGPSLSSHLQRHATLEQFREFVMHRSIYHLKEADPHAWGIPRLTGAAKAALVEIEADEYGGGRPERMHAELFRRLMRGMELDDTYGRYVEAVPAATLAVSNTMSLFGLNRRLRGALAGHLAALEMTSSLPNRAYSNGVQRLGFDLGTARFFDEHVEADAVHEQVAAHDLCGSLVADEPALAGDVLFGAQAALQVEAHFGERLLAAWAAGGTLLRGDNPVAPAGTLLSA